MLQFLLWLLLSLPLLCGAQWPEQAYAQPLSKYGQLVDSIGVVMMDSTDGHDTVVQATLLGWIQVYVKDGPDGTQTRFFFISRRISAGSALYSHEALMNVKPDKVSQRAFSAEMLKFLDQNTPLKK